jgi:O-antigen/teichoic acid export membrane protein
LNPIKKLASQTAIYGLSSVVGRFLNYLLFPIYTYAFSTADFGVISELYAYTGFFAVLLIFGFETGLFRFSQQQEQKKIVYSTALNFVLLANTLFVLLVFIFINPLASALRYPLHHDYFYWFALILAFDSVSLIPFARLRLENRAIRFATIKFIEIGVSVGLNVFFIVICKRAYEHGSSSVFAKWYNPEIGVGYIFIANLIASSVKLLLLIPDFRGIGKGIDRNLLIKMINYSLPMAVIGFAGIINEMLDRAILKFLLPFDPHTNMEQLGIYGACYKLSILMSLFIQAFRYAAEPFFFSHAAQSNSKTIYATVMKYFVIVCVGIFLLVMLYLNFFQYFIGKSFRVGLPVVPILLMANLALGVYVNLSIWYKLTDRTKMGAWVSIMGAVITLILNLVFIPTYGYMASAWATLACYGSMAVVSYILGQKYYPVNYDIGRIMGYIVFGLLLWVADVLLMHTVFASLQQYWWVLSTVIMLVYGVVVWTLDGRKLLGMER